VNRQAIDYEGEYSMDQITVGGVTLDLEVQGSGPPLLYLHAEHYHHLQQPFIDRLAESWTVHAPRHPGFDGRTPPEDFRRIDDLAYLYLDLLAQLDLDGVTLAGASFGGWIALEMAVRNVSCLSALALMTPLGARFGARDERDFADLFALPEAESASALFAGTPPDFASFNEDQLTATARDRQYVAYYAWKPYLHNPALARWLHRASVPTHLIWGAEDGFVSPEYGKKLADRMPGAKLDVLSGAGHYPQIERLDDTMAALRAGPCAP
jgi:pimeloyl-ACP methyl ester carboxylesterase